MRQYLDLLGDILSKGVERDDRTGTGTVSIFGRQLRFNLTEGFPLVTTKKVHFKSAAHELLWFVSGETNTKYLTDNGVRIWNEWADENGDLGPVYGKQWRNWTVPLDEATYWNFSIDQLRSTIEQIKDNPNSRRHLISAWNVGELPKMKLPPCHYAYQFYVANGKLSCICVMRSVDCFLGLPFDMVDYGLLTHMVAQCVGLEVQDLIFQLGDTHIYKNHLKQVAAQLKRDPRPLPTLELNPDIKDIDDFKYEDFRIVGYNPHPHIKGEVAV